MKRWVVEDFLGDNRMLEEKLNTLEESGRQVKEIFPVSCKDWLRCKIIYTEEDIMEVDE